MITKHYTTLLLGILRGQGNIQDVLNSTSSEDWQQKTDWWGTIVLLWFYFIFKIYSDIVLLFRA